MSQSVKPLLIFSMKCPPVEHHSLLDIWEVVGQMHLNWPDPSRINKLAALLKKKKKCFCYCNTIYIVFERLLQSPREVRMELNAHKDCNM